MIAWQIGALVLLAGYIPAGVVCLKGAPMDRLIGFQMASTLTLALLLILAQATSRPGFVDLALADAVLSLPAGLALARLMERWT